MSFTRNLVVLSLALSAFTSVAQAKELVVYSSRQDHLIKPVFEMYTEKTGVKINFITDREAPLMARLRAEGANTPADMFMTVDAGNLWQAEEQGLFQPVQSEVIEGNIPQHLRSSNNMWTGLSLRVRTIAYSTDREVSLMGRLRAEGANTPAYMFMTVDAGDLWEAEEQGLFQPVQSEVIEGNIPQHLRSSNNMWTGLSLRARTIAYSTERVKPE